MLKKFFVILCLSVTLTGCGATTTESAEITGGGEETIITETIITETITTETTI